MPNTRAHRTEATGSCGKGSRPSRRCRRPAPEPADSQAGQDKGLACLVWEAAQFTQASFPTAAPSHASPSYDEDTRPAQRRRPGTPQPGPAEAAAAGNFCIPAVPGAASADFFIDDEGRRVDLGNEDGGSDEDLSYVGD